MKYTPTTNDEWNKSRARALKPTPTETASYFGILIGLVLFLFVALISESPLLWILSLIAFGWYWIWQKKTAKQNDPTVMMEEAFEIYFKYAVDRVTEYYSISPAHQRLACAEVFNACVMPNSTPSIDITTDLWEGTNLYNGLLNPEDYVTQYPNGYYDYTMYFSEVAYRFMVACYRLNLGEAKIVNFAESMAYRLYGTGNKSDMKEFMIVNEPYNPCNTYPIDPEQGAELRFFDYRRAHDRNGWIWKAWVLASKRFTDDSKKHPRVLYNKQTMAEYERMWNMQESWNAKTNDAHFINQKRIMRQNFSNS